MIQWRIPFVNVSCLADNRSYLPQWIRARNSALLGILGYHENTVSWARPMRLYYRQLLTENTSSTPYIVLSPTSYSQPFLLYKKQDQCVFPGLDFAELLVKVYNCCSRITRHFFTTSVISSVGVVLHQRCSDIAVPLSAKMNCLLFIIPELYGDIML